MRPLNLYLAGNVSSELAKKLTQIGIRNRLVSYAYPKDLQFWIENTESVPGNIMLDSGAFSAWNRGINIDIFDYIHYIEKAQNLLAKKSPMKKLYVVNLDVIPGKQGIGKMVTEEQRKYSAEQGLRNLDILLKEGINPIHVFHQGENLTYLHEICRKVDYVGISPANDMSTISKKNWMWYIFEYLYENNLKVDTHGFAVSSVDILKRLPWASCDAASWIISAGVGNIFIPHGGFQNPDFTKPSIVYSISNRCDTTKLTKNIKRILETSGFSIEDMQEQNFVRYQINAMYILELQKWLNKYKEHREFIIHPKLL